MKMHLFFGCLFIPYMVFAQQRIENLVFEGAGIRGIAYAGVVQELESQQLLPQIKKVGGTSAGAIVALLVSLNYTSVEIEKIIGSTHFKRFNDGRFVIAGGINRLHKYFGWYRGVRFEQWLEDLIKTKTGNGDATFSDLNYKGFKELYVTGTNLNKQQLVIFSMQTFPHLRVKEAVRISMSIPLYFEPLYMSTDGNIIRRPKNKHDVDVMLDGGFIANYPIFLFDKKDEVRTPDYSTIGFRIDTDAQIQADSSKKGLAPMEINNLPQYITAFYNLIIESLNRQALTPADWERTVSISDGNIGPRIRKLKDWEIERLVTNGRKACAAFLQKRLLVQ